MASWILPLSGILQFNYLLLLPFQCEFPFYVGFQICCGMLKKNFTAKDKTFSPEVFLEETQRTQD